MRKNWLSPSAIILSLMIIAFYISNWSKTADLLLLDSFFRQRFSINKLLNIETDNKDVVMVGIDERFISEYNYRISELDRLFYAKAIDNLNNAGVKVIALDMFFPENSNQDSDIALAQSIKNAKIVLPQIRQSINTNGKNKEGFVAFSPLFKDVKRGVIS
ncbi:MAG TPA: CHASE2 domain-containing protein, partial [Trueperaceae bacterium]|nr:CHASE2 domain-containing protein [Trueperaceae bacterium]